MKLRAALTLGLAVLATATSWGQSGRFALAIVRSDGSIVPFAAYDGARWERAWPEADEAPVGTPTIDGTDSIWRKHGERVPRQWSVWPTTGAGPLQAHVKGIDLADAGCGRQLALTTNLPPLKAEDPAIVGVAVDSNIPVTSIKQIPESSSAWRTAAEIVLANFGKLEIATAQNDRQQLPRETTEPLARIAALYREADSPRSPMYFVAEKKYSTPTSPRDPSCERITVMTGWLVPSMDGTLTLLDVKVFLTDCDEKEVRTAVPVAAIHVSDRAFWVLQEHGYEDETYLMAEIGSSDIRYPIAVSAGGC